jgi:ArsR family transcriptional regulator
MYVPFMLRSTTSRPKAALLFHALSDPTRLELLERLKTGEQCVCDLTDLMHTGQSRLSFHLKVLKEAGLIDDRREGRWMYYSLNPGVIEELEELVVALKQAARAAASAGRRC